MVFAIIYKTTCLVNGKIYIGQRIIRNQNNLDRWYLGSGTHLKRAVDKYGFDNFQRDIICKVTDNNQAMVDKLEEFFIKKYNSTDLSIGYNILSGTANDFGSGSPMKNPIVVEKVFAKLRGRKGAKRSREARKHMSEAAKKSWEDKERRKKASKRMKQMMTETHKEHLSELKKGMKLSDEHKEKISKNHADFKGSNHPLYGVRYKWMTNGKLNKRVPIDFEIPKGWYNGKTQKLK